MQLKHVFSFGLLAIAVVMLSSCGENGSGTAPTAERTFINLGTAPTGGAFHPVGCAAANVVTENKGDLNWIVTPQGTKGTQENIRRLDDGELQFAMANAADESAKMVPVFVWPNSHIMGRIPRCT